MSPDELRSIRAHLGLSRRDLAAVLAQSPGTIRNWEQGFRTIPPLGARILRMLRQDAGLVDRLRTAG